MVNKCTLLDTRPGAFEHDLVGFSTRPKMVGIFVLQITTRKSVKGLFKKKEEGKTCVLLSCSSRRDC